MCSKCDLMRSSCRDLLICWGSLPRSCRRVSAEPLARAQSGRAAAERYQTR